MENILSLHPHPIDLTLVEKKECNICLKIIENRNVYNCVKCDLNICIDCFENKIKICNIDKEKKVHKHNLVLLKRGFWICDHCNKKYHRTISMYCEECDYDCCLYCYSKVEELKNIFKNFDISKSILLKKIESKTIPIISCNQYENGDFSVKYKDNTEIFIDGESLKEKKIEENMKQIINQYKYTNDENIKFDILNFEPYIYLKLKDESYLIGGKTNENNIIRDDLYQLILKKDKYESIGVKKQVHDSKITGIIQLNNGYIVTCSEDSSIKIWV